MSITKNLNFLTEFIKYTAKGFSVCKIYQILELKKLDIKNEIIEFGSDNYDESLIKFRKKNSKYVFFSNISKIVKKNYLCIDLEKKNIIKRKFKNILVFNVLEHIHNDGNAISEFYKILKSKGKLYISTPFLYRYHEAPKDYKRYTTEYFGKILKDKNFKIKKKISLGTGPFLASYSLLFDYLNKIPLIPVPFLILCFLIDFLISLFHENRKNKFYPVCIFIIAEKK